MIVFGVIAGAAFLSRGGDTFSYTPPSGGNYRFRLRKVGSNWRTYVLEQPAYAGRSSDGHMTHRYYDDSQSQYYVCYDPMPQTESDGRAVAKRWAERTTRYIRYGESF